MATAMVNYKQMSIKIIIAWLVLACDASCCPLSPLDLLGLTEAHRLAIQSIPRKLPGYETLLESTPRTIEAKRAQCIAIGSLRFINFDGSRSVFVIDLNRPFHRWELRDAAPPASWTRAVRFYIRDYLATSEVALKDEFGRDPLSSEDRRVLMDGLKTAPAPTIMTMPTLSELEASTSRLRLPVSSASVSALVLQKTLDAVGANKIQGWVRKIEIGQLPRVEGTVTVEVLLSNFPEKDSRTLHFTVPVNAFVRPYVGTMISLDQGGRR